jgi:hypothetical protein
LAGNNQSDFINKLFSIHQRHHHIGDN